MPPLLSKVLGYFTKNTTEVYYTSDVWTATKVLNDRKFARLRPRVQDSIKECDIR